MSIPNKKILTLLALGLAGWLGVRYLLPMLLPFLAGTGIALLAEPIVKLLSEKLHVPRGAAAGIGVSMVFALVCLVLTCLLGVLFRELGALAGILPDMESTLREGLAVLQGWLTQLSDQAPESLRPILRRNVTSLFSGGTALLDRAVRYGLGLAGTMLGHLPDSALGLGTSILSAFLISAKLPRLRRQCRGPNFQKLAALWKQVRSTALLWLAAQLKLTGITCGILTLGFLLLRIPYGPLWALGVSAVDAFPILGTGTVMLPWSLICFLQQDTPRALGLLGLYAIAALTRSMLEPKVLGSQLGLDPLVTLAALYAGFRLWGLGGMILMPMAAMTAAGLVRGDG